MGKPVHRINTITKMINRQRQPCYTGHGRGNIDCKINRQRQPCYTGHGRGNIDCKINRQRQPCYTGHGRGNCIVKISRQKLNCKINRQRQPVVVKPATICHQLQSGDLLPQFLLSSSVINNSAGQIFSPVDATKPAVQ